MDHEKKIKKKYVLKEIFKSGNSNQEKQQISKHQKVNEEKKKMNVTLKQKLFDKKDQSQHQSDIIPKRQIETSKTVETSNFQKKKKKYVNYEDEDNLVPVKDMIDDADSRKLKQYLREVNQNADRIILRYQTNKPVVLFQFFIKDQKNLLHIRDLMSANQKLKKNRQLITRVYQTLFRKVDQKYYEIGVFAVEFAHQRRIHFRDKNFKTKSKESIIKQYPFYYMIKNHKINFIIFDSILNSIQFTTDAILGLHKKFQDQFKIYKQFEQKQIKNEEVQQLISQNFGQQEIDSDEEDRAKKNLKQITIEELRAKINRLLNKDISEFEQKIESKNQQIELLQKQSSKEAQQKVIKRADQVMQDQASLDNFIETRNQVKAKIEQYRNGEYQLKILKICMKKMILADKQLASKLPIIARKRQIFEKLNKNNLLILQGETGSGKSTQLPQMLCQYYNIFQNDTALPVLITQPRKLATRTLAERVATQMQERVHGFVDYQTSLTNNVNDKAKIVFKMDRLVLDELKVDPILSKYCCLVIDEAHERTISIDVILGLIKKLLQMRKDFKIIVTSASMDIQLFKEYYKTEVLKVSGRMFPVKQLFYPYEHQKDVTRKIQRLINQQLLDDQQRSLRPQYKGHILAFCSGIDQISELHDIFSKKLNPRVFKVLSLHGKLTPDEQRQVFASTQQYKIIFTSRIAQTSITIDGVRVVIDPGEDREMVYDQKNKVTSLKLKLISRSSAKQRAGRAGRTNTGYCFRLYSPKVMNQLKINKTPQIQNMALDTVVLRLKSLQIHDIINFPYLSKPDEQGLKNSIQLMKMLNCLNQQTQKITTVGQFLVRIPIQPFLARAIIESMLMQKVIKTNKNIQQKLSMNADQKTKLANINLIQQTIRILCMVVNVSNLFYIRPEDREKADKKKFEKLSDQHGDFFFLENIYNQFINYYNKRQTETMRWWAKDHFLSLKTLNQARQLQKEISQIIKQFKINEDRLTHELQIAYTKLTQAKTTRQALLSCLVSSFATNLALNSENQFLGYTIVSSELPIQIYGTSIMSLQGINPKWILFYDLYENQKGQMYCKVANSIDYNFLLKNSHQYIIKKFNIRKAQLINPYYQKITKKLPTLLYLQILNDYQRRFYQQYSQIQFLNKFYINFYEDLNTIDIFYNKKNFQVQTLNAQGTLLKTINNFLNLTKFRENKKNALQIIEGYIEEIKSKYSKPLKYNYVGPIYIQLNQGFQLREIDFKTAQHIFKVVTADQNIKKIIRHYCNPYGTCQTYSDKLIFKITDETVKKQFQFIIAQIIKIYEQSNNKIKIIHEVQDRRKKIPQAKLFMHFFAGQAQKQNIYLNYNGQTPQKVQQMQACLNNGISKLNQNAINIIRGRQQQHNLRGLSFKIAKNKKGINCYCRLRSLDQIELFQIINQIDKQRNVFGYNFQMPKFFQKFRDPNISQATRSQIQWENIIKKLLSRNGIQQQKVTVRVWGKKFYSDNYQKKLSVLQKSMKVEWHAEIKSYDLKILQRFKQTNDKMRGIIGSEKVHIKFQFQHIAAIATLNAFRSLKEQFDDVVNLICGSNPLISIDWYEKTFRKFTKVYIRIRGQNRDELISPSLRINKLFSPKLIHLNQSHFRFLDKSDFGNSLLENIENSYNYKIYFAFDRKNVSLKLYCHDTEFNDIHDLLKKQLNQVRVLQQQISYRGKNLHQVKQIIQDKIQQITQNNLKNKVLNYQIIFKFRKVRLIADFETLQEVKNQIMKIINKQKQQCQICCSLLQKPYRLSVCLHQFCWMCLSSYIREVINNVSSELLKCPGCDKPINVFDVQRIMSDDEFNKLCDIQIAREIERNKKYHGCWSPNCQNIFISAETQMKGSFECELCGKEYCKKCKSSHKGYSCQEWKFSANENQLKKLGIKKCPKCGEGIQKNQGCQHMTCIKCKSHICWNCMKIFATDKQCYDHLAKQCGGIFVRQ